MKDLVSVPNGFCKTTLFLHVMAVWATSAAQADFGHFVNRLA